MNLPQIRRQDSCRHGPGGPIQPATGTIFTESKVIGFGTVCVSNSVIAMHTAACMAA